MATGVQALLGVDWALSTTGVAGPDRQEGQAVGTVYVGLAGPDGVRSGVLPPRRRPGRDPQLRVCQRRSSCC